MSLTATDLNQIKTIVQHVVKDATKDILTKSDAQNFATKSDLSAFATKSDLKAFATKSDFQVLATKSDLQGFATKIDLQSLAKSLERMESRLATAIGLLQRDSFSRLDQHEARITRLENAR